MHANEMTGVVITDFRSLGATKQLPPRMLSITQCTACIAACMIYACTPSPDSAPRYCPEWLDMTAVVIFL